MFTYIQIFRKNEWSETSRTKSRKRWRLFKADCLHVGSPVRVYVRAARIFRGTDRRGTFLKIFEFVGNFYVSGKIQRDWICHIKQQIFIKFGHKDFSMRVLWWYQAGFQIDADWLIVSPNQRSNINLKINLSVLSSNVPTPLAFHFLLHWNGWLVIAL